MAIGVGSRVRVVRTDVDGYVGRVGTVAEVCAPGSCFNVRLDGDEDTTHFFANNSYEGLEELVDDFDVSLALAGLEARVRDDEQVLNDVQTLMTTARSRTLETRKLLEQTKAALDLPPFKVGQRVRTPSKGVLVVDAIDRAFNQWVVLGHFSSNVSPNGTVLKQYTYPASELEAA